MTGPVAAILPDGKRLHLQHGPIDLIIGADAALPDGVRTAYRAAARRFETVLAELAEELPKLRAPCPPQGLGLAGPVARRMEAAVLPHAATLFVTPMAAVAGAVAEEILDAMTAAAPLQRAYVNNGGDIAFHLGGDREFNMKIAALDNADHGQVRIEARSTVRGVATSGRGGRSLSLGIADAVTVLARNAAAADVAATLIANAVDLQDHPAITRRSASSLDPDSDLGDRLVVTACAPLSAADIAGALDQGLAAANRMQAAGLIAAAALFLQGDSRTTGMAQRAARQETEPPWREPAHA